MHTASRLEPQIDAPAADDLPAADVTSSEVLSFGARLRAERERRHLSIATIADRTKILGALLEGLEHDDVSRWPETGFYRRAFIRAYAVAIGLDPVPVIREFVERYPDAEEQPERQAAVPVAAPPPTTGAAPVMRLTLADSGPFARGAVLASIGPRLRAVALDLFVLGVVGLGLFVVFGTVWAPLSLAIAAYYAGSILLLGNTPGVCLFATRRRLAARRDGD
jgi:transcriptional regulator with XRE-family HTH domain